MKVFINHQFNSYPDLFYILNKHLQDNVALKVDVNWMDADMAWRKHELLTVGKKVDTITTKVNRRN